MRTVSSPPTASWRTTRNPTCSPMPASARNRTVLPTPRSPVTIRCWLVRAAAETLHADPGLVDDLVTPDQRRGWRASTRGVRVGHRVVPFT